MYKITLGNGNVISDVWKNCDTFFTKQRISRDIFEGGLNKIIIQKVSDTGNEFETDSPEGTFTNLRLTECRQDRNNPAQYYFTMSEISEQEMKEAALNAKIDYLAMMSGIEID